MKIRTPLRLLSALLTLEGLLGATALLALALGTTAQTPGSLDANFDVDGKVTVPFATGSAMGYAVVERADHDIYVVGNCETSSGRNIALARIIPDGSLDQSYDGDGKVLAEDEPYTVAYGAVREPGGKVIVTGHSGASSSDHRLMVARFNVDGSLDNTFGSSGFVTTEFVSGQSSRGWDVALQTDGKIVVAGWSGSHMAVARFLSNGTLDPSFDSDGKKTIQFDFADSWAHALVIDNVGKITIAGTCQGGNKWFAAARLEPNGDFDNGFGTQGKTGWPNLYAGDLNEAWDVIVDSDSKVVLAGIVGSSGGQTWPTLIRFNSDGTPDYTFNSFPEQNYNLGNNGGFYALLEQPDGRYACAGELNVNWSERFFLLALVDHGGTLDNDFGNAGFVTTDFGSGISEECARGIITQELNTDTVITVVGYSQSNPNQPLAMSIARFYSHLTVGIVDFTQPSTNVLVFPNPIAAATTLLYTLAETSEIAIALNDLQGRQLTTYLSAKEMSAGEHTQTITMPSGLAPGNYMLVLSSPKGKMSIQVTKAE